MKNEISDGENLNVIILYITFNTKISSKINNIFLIDIPFKSVDIFYFSSKLYSFIHEPTAFVAMMHKGIHRISLLEMYNESRIKSPALC